MSDGPRLLLGLGGGLLALIGLVGQDAIPGLVRVLMVVVGVPLAAWGSKVWR